MQTEKPEIVQFYTELLAKILRDTAHSLGIRSKDYEADIASVRRRVLSEGMNYLTVVLPQLGRAFDKALASDTKFVCPPFFKARTYGEVELPIFIGSYFKLVFRQDGRLKEHDLDNADLRHYEGLGLNPDTSSNIQIMAVSAIRQICFLAYKLKYVPSDEAVRTKIKEFESLDNNLYSDDKFLTLSSEARRALENARLILSYLFRDLDDLRNVCPKHGPGAVATRETMAEKFNFSRIYQSLEEYFPFVDYMLFNYTHLCDRLDKLTQLEELDESCTRACFVPKDSRGPRLIASEPLEIQWIQQGLHRLIVDKVEDSRSVTHGYVNFTDQNVNRCLALQNSQDGEFVTTDLSDASDRVSVDVVRAIFPTGLFERLMSCRSPLTMFPDGHCVRLKKFASMGSAVCFPVEALTFWSIAVGTLTHILRGKDLRSLPKVYVYGDDIILRKEDYARVHDVFEELSFKFSETKCCVGRFFRESCGCDAFKGINVTPLKLKTLMTERLSPEALLSWVTYANSFEESTLRLTSAAQFVRDHLKRTQRRIPIGQKGCRNAFAFKFDHIGIEDVELANSAFRSRWNSHLQRTEFKLPCILPLVTTCEYEDEWSRMWRVPSIRIDALGTANILDSDEFTQPHCVKLGWTWQSLDALLR